MNRCRNFEKFPQIQRLMIGDGLVGNKIDFETDLRPDQDPVKFLSEVYCWCTWERVTMRARVCLINASTNYSILNLHI